MQCHVIIYTCAIRQLCLRQRYSVDRSSPEAQELREEGFGISTDIYCKHTRLTFWLPVSVRVPTIII